MKMRKYNSRAAKLTNEQVIEIRRRYNEERWTQGRLARHFEMSVVQIGRIVRGESHAALDGAPVASEVELANAAQRLQAFQERLLAGAEPAKKVEETKFNDPLKDKLKPYA